MTVNLALSNRGWKALEGAGIRREVEEIAIPMPGRIMQALKRVEVNNKQVRLEGILTEEKLKQLAQEQAQFLAPKRDINNNIIALESLVNPLLVDIRLRETLEQLNQHQGTDINSTYENGTVTLKGTADSWTNIAAINRTIASIPGVLKVISQIT